MTRLFHSGHFGIRVRKFTPILIMALSLPFYSGCCGDPDGEQICFDGADDDGDGLVDWDDPDCDCFGIPIDIRVQPTPPANPQITASIMDMPHQEMLIVGPDGCVNAHCGRFCNLKPGQQVTIDCGKHAVFFLPSGWLYSFGFWTRPGMTGTITKMIDPANAPPQRSLPNLTIDHQLCAFEAATIPNDLALYDIELNFSRSPFAPKTEFAAFLPVVAIRGLGDKGPPQLHSIHSAPVATELPVYLSRAIVTPTMDNDVSIHILAVNDHAALGDLVRFKTYAVNHGSAAVTNAAVAGSLSNLVFNAAASDPNIIHNGAPVGGTWQYTITTIDPTSSMGFEVAGTVSPGAATCSAGASITGSMADPDISDNSSSSLVTVGDFADLRVERLDTQQNPMLQGVANTLTLTIRNRGPLAATGNVLVDVQGAELVSTTAGVIVGNQLQVTTRLLTNHAFYKFDFDILPDAAATSAAVTAGVTVMELGRTDQDASNDTAMIQLPVLDSTGNTPAVLFSTINVRDWMGGAYAPALVPGVVGQGFRGFGRPYVSNDENHWAFVSQIAPDLAAFAVEEMIIQVTENGTRTVTPVLQSGTSVIPGINDVLSSIDLKIGVNDSGAVAVAGQRTTTTDRVILSATGNNLPGGNGIINVIAHYGNRIPGVPGSSYPSTRFSEPQMRNDGSVTFLAGITPANTSMDQIIINAPPNGASATILLQEGVTIPTGQAGGAIQKIDEFRAELFARRLATYETNDGNTLLQRCDLEGATTSDDVLLVNGAVVLQEGQILPPFSAAINDPAFGMNLAPNGDWYAIGNNPGSFAWLVKNGSVVAANGQALYPGSTETWNGFFGVAGDSAGRYVIAGRAMPSFDTVLVYNDNLNPPREVARAGDPIDADSNGLFDDKLFILNFGNDGMVLLSGERLVTQATLASAKSVTDVVGTAMVLYELNPQPVPGDVNGDGKVDLGDFRELQNCFGTITGPGEPCLPTDLNDDGMVDELDVQEFVNNLL